MGDMKFNLVDYQATKLDDQSVQLMKVRNDQTSEPITFTFFKGNSTEYVAQALQAGVELLSLSIKGKEEQKND